MSSRPLISSGRVLPWPSGISAKRTVTHSSGPAACYPGRQRFPLGGQSAARQLRQGVALAVRDFSLGGRSPAGQLRRRAALSDLRLQRGELVLHVGVGSGLVEFLLDIVGVTPDVF